MSVRTVLGTMAIGGPLDTQKTKIVLKHFKSHGFSELDTALMYQGGKSEKTLGEALKDEEGFQVGTKVNPWFDVSTGRTTTEPCGSLSPQGIRTQFDISLRSLQLQKIDLFYLHAPDHATPLDQIVNTVNELYKNGKFVEWGLSNFHATEVAEIQNLCAERGWKPPTVYQGMYNCLTRAVEPELFPILRQHKMRFYAYNPLAGGILTGRYKYEDKPGSGRFNVETLWGQRYRQRFWTKSVFEAIEKIKHAGAPHNITLLDASLRWMYHHSALKGEYGDAVILGGSSVEHLKNNIDLCVASKPLPQDVVKAIEEAWHSTKQDCPIYFR